MGFKIQKIVRKWVVTGSYFVENHKGHDIVEEIEPLLFNTKSAAERWVAAREKDQQFILKQNETCRVLRREAVDAYLAKRAKRNADQLKLF